MPSYEPKNLLKQGISGGCTRGNTSLRISDWVPHLDFKNLLKQGISGNTTIRLSDWVPHLDFKNLLKQGISGGYSLPYLNEDIRLSPAFGFLKITSKYEMSGKKLQHSSGYFISDLRKLIRIATINYEYIMYLFITNLNVYVDHSVETKCYGIWI